MEDAARYLLLSLLKVHGGPLEKHALYRHLKAALEKAGVKSLKFYGGTPYSPELEGLVEDLVSKGLVRRIYMVGPSYVELYREYLAITPEGEKLLADESSKKFVDLASKVAKGRAED